MLLLPYENYNLYSHLPIEKIRERLAKNLQAGLEVPFPVYANSRPFIGDSGEKGFRIFRRIQYRNGSLPIVTGAYFQENGTTRIHVLMKIRTLTQVWMVILIGLFSLPGLLNHQFLLSLGIVSFIYVPNLIAFKIESRKAKKFLTELFEAQPSIP